MNQVVGKTVVIVNDRYCFHGIFLLKPFDCAQGDNIYNDYCLQTDYCFLNTDHYIVSASSSALLSAPNLL